MLHEKPQASILLEVDLSVCPKSSYYYYYYNYSVEYFLPQTSLGRQETPSILGRSTPWYFKLQWMSCSRCWVCWTLTEIDESSLNKQWSEFEFTLYHIHSEATWRRWHIDKKLIISKEYTWRSSSGRCYSAADFHTGEQYSRIGRTK